MRSVPVCLLLAAPLAAADLKPDATSAIPPSAERSLVVEFNQHENGKAIAEIAHTLPAGFTLEVAAVPPLVTHPIMGCLDDRGRLFVGDAVGVNWNKAQLEANPPNRVLMLEDRDGDGVFDKSTIFADKMTFPQGACWHDGSLFVCSPPSLWKLTDTDDDGVADQREEIVTGFDYTGNAADVHGPKLHPNGRLYWCHGRKKHNIKQKDGALVREGLSSGIWTCLPDGSDVRWHALGCADNPTGLDFTPDGDLIGTCNLYYSNPRGDTLMHWLYGGVYERADQMKAIEGLPRTLEKMPVIHNFGHVAVSGCAFWRAYDANALNLMVTHFNTQRLVRVEMNRSGSTYSAVENEFFKINDPDVHLTDVFEDPRDGSLLILNTGGWFRIGCPSSLMAKSDLLGCVYRIKGSGKPAIAPVTPPKLEAEAAIQNLASNDPHVRRHAMEWLHQHVPEDHPHSAQTGAINAALRSLLGGELDAATEHFLIALSRKFYAVGYHDVKEARDLATLRRALLCFTPDDGASANLVAGIASDHLDSLNPELARVALNMVVAHSDADEWFTPKLEKWLVEEDLAPHQHAALRAYGAALITKPNTQRLVAALLRHPSEAARQSAVDILASQHEPVLNEAWLSPLQRLLDEAPSQRLLDAIKALQSSSFDRQLQELAADAGQPVSIRLKALDSVKHLKLNATAFEFVLGALIDGSSSVAAGIQAAAMLAKAPLDSDQIMRVAPAFAAVGPVEIRELLKLARKVKDAGIARAFAVELVKNPALIGQQESLYRTAFSNAAPEIFEAVIHPAYARAEAGLEEKKRQLGELAGKAGKTGDPERGRQLFEQGAGSCLACHKVGETGRDVGPNLSHIGAIRTERDLLESILFPSNTLARDYEAHLFETRDGQTHLGVIRSHTAEGLLIVDVAGQEKVLPHTQIIAETVLPTSLMPMGLDQTLPETDLLHLTAYLRSLK